GSLLRKPRHPPRAGSTYGWRHRKPARGRCKGESECGNHVPCPGPAAESQKTEFGPSLWPGRSSCSSAYRRFFLKRNSDLWFFRPKPRPNKRIFSLFFRAQNLLKSKFFLHLCGTAGNSHTHDFQRSLLL